MDKTPLLIVYEDLIAVAELINEVIINVNKLSYLRGIVLMLEPTKYHC